MLIPPTRVGIGQGQTDSEYMFINLFRLANSQEPTCEVRTGEGQTDSKYMFINLFHLANSQEPTSEVSKSGDGTAYGLEGRKARIP